MPFSDLVTRKFGVQPGEMKKTGLLFVYLFLLVAGFIMAKSVRDGIFLTQNTPLNLPYLYIAIAAFMLPALSLYSRLCRRCGVQNTMVGTQLFISLSLLVFWYLFSSHQNLLSIASFYVWVSIFGAIGTSQFWLIAAQMNDPRSAKRLFGMIGSGGILGGIVGGFSASRIAEGWGTEALIPIVSGIYLLCSILIKVVSDTQADCGPLTSPSPAAGGFRILKESRYLLWITIVLFLTELISTFVDFQFKVIVSNEFPEKNELTAFLGSFYGFLNIANFLFQAFLTARIIQWAGVKGAILFLPLTILSGSLALFYIPVLWTVLWLKIGDDGLRHSLHRSVLELLYQPVPAAIRGNAKVFLDSFAVQSATALGGFVLLIYTAGYGSALSPLALLVFFLSLGWIILCFIANREYINAFREGLKKRAIDLETVSLQIVDVPTLEVLMQAMNSTDEKVVLYAVEFLQRGGKAYLVSPWLLYHPSAKVRLKVVELISRRSDRSALGLLKGAIQDENVEVQAEALQTICLLEPERHEEMVFSLSAEKDPKLRRAAILCAALGLEEQQQLARYWLKEMIEAGGPDSTVMQMEAAKALAKLPSSFHDLFPAVLNHPDHAVVRQAIRSAALSGNPELIPLLVEKLGDRKLKAEARQALLKFGPEIIPILEQHLINHAVPLWARRHIPRTMGAFGTQQAADTLFNHFDHPDGFISYKILKALNQLRARQSELTFDRQKVEQRLIQEAREYFDRLAIKQAIFAGNGAAAGDFLARSLDRRLDHNVDCLFRFLALVYSYRDVFNAYTSLKSSEPAFRSAAIEYLDNALERSVRRIVLPVIDAIPENEKLTRIQSVLPVRKRTADEALTELLSGTDAWLSASVIYWIYQQKRRDLYPLLSVSRNSTDRLVRETADWVLSRIGSLSSAAGMQQDA